MELPRCSSIFYTQLLRTYVRPMRDAAPVKYSSFTAPGRSSQLLLQLLWGGAPGRVDAMRHTVHTNGGAKVYKLGGILYNLARKSVQISTNFIQIGTIILYNSIP